MITVMAVKTAKQMREFVRFPLELYKNCDKYVPALFGDEMNLTNPKKNPMLAECEICCYLAKKDGKTAGRVAAILQKKYNEISGRKCIRFSRFDCIDDPDVAKALLDAVEKFGKERGMDTIHGPWGFNDQDREGLLTYGFDRRATYATNYNYEYYEKLVRGAGFSDESEWVEYDFTIPDSLDPRIEHVAGYIQKNSDCRNLRKACR